MQQARTKRQREVLTFITTYIEEHGYEPTYQLIAEHLGVSSKGGVVKHIEALEKQGLLLRNRDNGGFNLEVNPQSVIGDYTCEIDWLDSTDYLSTHHLSKRLYIPIFMLGRISPLNIRALRIKDNSLLDKNICEDDIALIKLEPSVRDGTCVAALINNTNIVMRLYYRMGSNIELAPQNDSYDTITCSAENVTILGSYCGLIRPVS